MRLFSDRMRKRIISLTVATVTVSAASYVTQPSAVAQISAMNPAAQNCAPQLRLTANPGAMITLDAVMPCQTDARVDVRHGPLRFSTRTDARGAVLIDIPALDRDAHLSIASGDTETAARIAVPDAGHFQRVALQWQGDATLNIQALERDRRTGAAHRVWIDDRKLPLRSLRDKGGFLMVLGGDVPDGWRSQVYSVPASMAPDGIVRLRVAATATAANCGQGLNAEVVQDDFSGQSSASPVALTLPGCGSGTETLVLKNLLRDLKLAMN